MRTLIMPYKKGSASAGFLARELNIRQVRIEGSAIKGSAKILLINWGSSSYHGSLEFEKCDVLNEPCFVAQCSNKLDFFRATDAKFTIPWTTDKDAVKQWLAGGSRVFARKVLNGHSGIGIVDMGPENVDEWVDAPLYTQYVPKKHEFRYHFFKGRVIDKQRKGYLQDIENGENKVDPARFRIRNLANGFVFARNFGDSLAVVDTLVQDYLDNHCDLDFGAIDLIYNERANRAYILEVNTAPGLKGTTLGIYANAFKEYLNAL